MGALYNPLDEIDKTAVAGILKGDGAAISAAVSGTDIKTVNGASLLGAGDVAIGSGALVYLSSVTATNSATADIETGFSSTYDDYMIIGEGVYSSATGNQLMVRFKLGGAYVTTSTYNAHCTISQAGQSTYAGAEVNSATAGILSSSGALVASADAPGSSMQFTMFINGANDSNCKTVRTIGSSISGNRFANAQVNNTGTGVLSGIRLYASASNITGTFKLYGIAKA